MPIEYILDITEKHKYLLDEIDYFLSRYPSLTKDNIVKKCFTFCNFNEIPVVEGDEESFMYSVKKNDDGVKNVSKYNYGEVYVQLDNNRIFNFRKYDEIKEMNEKSNIRVLRVLKKHGFYIPDSFFIRQKPVYDNYYVSIFLESEEHYDLTYYTYGLIEFILKNGEFDSLEIGPTWTTGNKKGESFYNQEHLNIMEKSKYYLYKFGGRYMAKRNFDKRILNFDERKIKACLFDLMEQNSLYGLADMTVPVFCEEDSDTTESTESDSKTQYESD